MYLDDCVCVLSDLTWLPLLGVGRKSWYIIRYIYIYSLTVRLINLINNLFYSFFIICLLTIQLPGQLPSSLLSSYYAADNLLTTQLPGQLPSSLTIYGMQCTTFICFILNVVIKVGLNHFIEEYCTIWKVQTIEYMVQVVLQTPIEARYNWYFWPKT